MITSDCPVEMGAIPNPSPLIFGGITLTPVCEPYAYSRYVVAWKLCTTMKAGDVTYTLELALEASCCDKAIVKHKPRLLSDNGASYVAGELAEWPADKKMSHVCGAPYHPQT